MLTSLQLEILLSVTTGPLHGYGIKLDIERRRQGEIQLTSGSLYQAIHRLESTGLIVETEGPTGEADDARRGRYYGLSDRGRDCLESELRRLSRIVEDGRERDLLGEPSN